MRAFAELVATLDRSAGTPEKVAALEGYLRSVPPADAAWAIWFLSGRRLKRILQPAWLRDCVAEETGIPRWLVDECRKTVGDLSETLALLLPPNPSPHPPLLSSLIQDYLLPMLDAPEASQREQLRALWKCLDTPQRILGNQLLTGKFRLGISRSLLIRAMAGVASVAPAVMTFRLMGDWKPTPADFARLVSSDRPEDDPARPYPFQLATPWDAEISELGDLRNWMVEWQWDGLRVQLIRRAGRVVLWSRGEEVITPSLPEIADAAACLPDGTVLDGEVLGWRGDAPLPFVQLQRRLNRRAPTAALQSQIPVVFMAYDLLEHAGHDLRDRPLAQRRQALEALIQPASDPAVQIGDRRRVPQLRQGDLFEATSATAATAPGPMGPSSMVLRASPILPVATWEDVSALRHGARAHGNRGVMLKHRDSGYAAGRPRGIWWTWKVDPFTCDAVLVAAQPGHGRRAHLFTDYTFAVWHEGRLVPITKAHSGLTDAEFTAVDEFVRRHTTGRFGPVRSVEPRLVFELAFDGIAASPRKASGLALRFPRMARWCHDKPADQADTLETLQRLANAPRSGGLRPEVHPPGEPA